MAAGLDGCGYADRSRAASGEHEVGIRAGPLIAISMIGRDMCNRLNEPALHDFLRRAMPGLLFFYDAELAVLRHQRCWRSAHHIQRQRRVVLVRRRAGDRRSERGRAGQIILSSVGNANGTGGASRNGDVEVTSYDLATAALNHFTLADNLEADDHDSAALLKLPDGHFLSSYSKHSGDSVIHWRISTSPGSIAAWGPESTYSESGGTTYSNLTYLSASGDVFDFHRVAGAVGGFDPNYLKWDLPTQSGFSFGGRLLTGPEGNSGSSDRPYVRYTSNGVDRIDFITTDAHPRNQLSNSVYHGYIQYEGGSSYGVYKSDGTP